MTSYSRFNPNSRTGRWGQSAGSKPQGPGSSSGKSLDMSDFPALGLGRPDPMSSSNLTTNNANRAELFNSIVTGNRTVTSTTTNVTPGINLDDFPALPGAGHATALNRHRETGSDPTVVASLTSSLNNLSVMPISPANQYDLLHRLTGNVDGGTAPHGDRGNFPPSAGVGLQQGVDSISFNSLKSGLLDATSELRSPLVGHGTSVAAAAAAAAASVTHAADLSPREPETNYVGSQDKDHFSTRGSDFESANQFGLLGLLDTLKTSNPDKSALAFGFDVSKFGLNLASRGLLYATFTTPWIDQSQANLAQIKPEFSLPACYQVRPRRLALERLDRFTDETLFYIFYTMPQDELQERAAQELYRRNWRYHIGMKLWLTKDTSATESSEGREFMKTPAGEEAFYYFFDPSTWQKVRKESVIRYDALEDRHATSTLDNNGGGASGRGLPGSAAAQSTNSSMADVNHGGMGGSGLFQGNGDPTGLSSHGSTTTSNAGNPLNDVLGGNPLSRQLLNTGGFNEGNPSDYLSQLQQQQQQQQVDSLSGTDLYDGQHLMLSQQQHSGGHPNLHNVGNPQSLHQLFQHFPQQQQGGLNPSVLSFAGSNGQQSMMSPGGSDPTNPNTSMASLLSNPGMTGSSLAHLMGGPGGSSSGGLNDL
ncbi:transcriptional regulator [Dispira simplex]|nr:transcriptional regulator [Dispira simplex]